MEKRLYNRVVVQFEAEIASDGKVHPGKIKDISEEGLGSILTTQIDVGEGFSPDHLIRVNFQLPDGKKLSFECEIRWLTWDEPERKQLTLGVKIIKPTAEYIEYIRANVFESG